MICSSPTLLEPTLAFRSPITISIFFLFTLFVVFCNYT
jgi:hypothetical protein